MNSSLRNFILKIHTLFLFFPHVDVVHLPMEATPPPPPPGSCSFSMSEKCKTILTYLNILWDNCYFHCLVPISVESFSFKLCINKSFKHLSLPSLHHRRMRGNMNDVYKYLHGLYNTNLHMFLPGSRRENTWFPEAREKVFQVRCEEIFLCK